MAHITLPSTPAAEWIQRIDTQGGVCVPQVISNALRSSLIEELSILTLTQQPETHGPRKVRQSFTAVASFPPTGHFAKFATSLGRAISTWFCASRNDVFISPLSFTDLVAQQYPPHGGGIAPHRDGKSFINLVAVLILEGEGNFQFCDDDSGANPRLIKNEPGDLILMRGVGFCARDHQPHHFVDGIRSRRTTFGMRQRLKEL
jgi:hypothetical protein